MKITSQDFVRRLPDSNVQFARGPAWSHRLRVDPILLLLLLVITCFGLAVLYSASGQNELMLRRQGIFFIIAYSAMFITAQLDLQMLRRWSVWLYLVGIILLIAVLLIGVGAKGAKRWVSLGFIRFQPSEILKIAVPVMMAAYFSARRLPPSLADVLMSLVIVVDPWCAHFFTARLRHGDSNLNLRFDRSVYGGLTVALHFWQLGNGWGEYLANVAFHHEGLPKAAGVDAFGP